MNDVSPVFVSGITANAENWEQSSAVVCYFHDIVRAILNEGDEETLRFNCNKWVKPPLKLTTLPSVSQFHYLNHIDLNSLDLLISLCIPST